MLCNVNMCDHATVPFRVTRTYSQGGPGGILVVGVYVLCLERGISPKYADPQSIGPPLHPAEKSSGLLAHVILHGRAREDIFRQRPSDNA